MDRVADGGEIWRNDLKPFLQKHKIVILDPCDKPIDIGIEDKASREDINQLKREGKFEHLRRDYGEIRSVDLRMCDKADFIIALVDVDQHLCGSYEEIFTCNRDKKPVLVWSVGGKEKAPNWLFFTLPHELIFGSIAEVEEYIRHIDEDKEIDTLNNRWKFFDLEYYT